MSISFSNNMYIIVTNVTIQFHNALIKCQIYCSIAEKSVNFDLSNMCYTKISSKWTFIFDLLDF